MPAAAAVAVSTGAELAAALAAAFTGSAVSVYVQPAKPIVPPAVVIRADIPWRAPSGLCPVTARWLAIAVVGAAADPLWPQIETIAADIETAAQEAGWRWTGTDPPYLDESTGAPLLAAAVHVETDL
jgi:hypothetical protein